MSKGLEALKRIRPYADSSIDADLENIEKELKRLEEYDKTEYSALIDSHKKLLKEKKYNEKKLKALEIIRKKKVDVAIFFEDGCARHRERLTQEECELLKEVLS